MKRKKYQSSLVNKTGYTPGYKTESNPINFIPSENISMANTPYPLQGTPLDEYGNPIGKQTLMMPGNEYNFPGASYVAEVPQFQVGGTLLTSPKGNKLTTSEWNMIKTKGVWTDPQEYLNYIDGWAKPDSVMDPTSPSLNLGQGSSRVPVPAQDVINQLKSSLENKELAKFYTKNDWDFENLGNLQGQLDSEYRKNDAGFNIAIGNLSQRPTKKEEPITDFLASTPKFQFGGEQLPKYQFGVLTPQFKNMNGPYPTVKEPTEQERADKLNRSFINQELNSDWSPLQGGNIPNKPKTAPQPQTTNPFNFAPKLPGLNGEDMDMTINPDGTSNYDPTPTTPNFNKPSVDEMTENGVIKREPSTTENKQEQQRKQFVQFNNPYGDVGLDTSLMGLGKAIKSGDGLGIATYGANTLLKSAKGFLSGFGAEKRSQQNMKGFYDNFRENITGENRPTYMQEGGEQQAGIEQQVAQALQQGADPQALLAQLVQSGMDQAQATQLIQAIMQQMQGQQEEPMMRDGGQLTEKERLQEKTGEAIAPLPEAQEDMANAEIERNEYIMDSKGIRKALGETHESGGAPVKLEEGTKVLSDHLKVGADTAKQLSGKLGVKVKASDTYAKVVDLYNKKSGLDKTHIEIEGLVKLLEKQQSDVKDENTSNLNTQFLIGQIKKQTEEKLPIEKERETLFNTLFDLQEKSKGPEKSTDDLDKMENGGMIKELAIKYNIPMDKVLELIPKYQAGGPVSVNNTNNTFSNAPADETWLPYTPIKDATNPLWQGKNYENQWKPLVEKSMAKPENAKQIEEWLLNKTGEYGKNVKKQLEGLQGEERTKRIIALATDQKPGPFHNAFLQAVKETVKPVETQKVEKVVNPIDEYNSRNSEIENVAGNLNLPVRPLNMPTWTPSLKTSTRLNTIDPALISPEQQIAENDRAILAAQQNLQELSPSQRALATVALTANQISANSKATQEANRFNAQAENSANVYNARVADTEQQAENQNALSYEARTLKGLGAFENDMQNLNNQQFRDQTNNWKAVEYYNQNNALNPSVQFTGTQGYVVNTPGLADSLKGLTDAFQTASPEEKKKILDELAKSQKPEKKKLGGRFKKK